MKKIVFSAIALFVLAGNTSNALTFSATQIADKPKAGGGTPTPSTPAPGPQTASIPPGCPYNDPNGCGILD